MARRSQKGNLKGAWLNSPAAGRVDCVLAGVAQAGEGGRGGASERAKKKTPLQFTTTNGAWISGMAFVFETTWTALRTSKNIEMAKRKRVHPKTTQDCRHVQPKRDFPNWPYPQILYQFLSLR